MPQLRPDAAKERKKERNHQSIRRKYIGVQKTFLSSTLKNHEKHGLIQQQKTIQCKQQKQSPDTEPKGKLQTCKKKYPATQMAGKGLPSLIHKELLRINKKINPMAERMDR